MQEDRMVELAQTLAEVKSRQDVTAALTLMHSDMLLENPAFGTAARGHEANARALTRWFRAFPDYDVVLEDHASNNEALICWGTVRMTMTGDGFGVTANGHRAEVPVFIHFTFAEDLIVGERFVFDLAELCDQSGVSTDTVRQRLFGSAAL